MTSGISLFPVLNDRLRDRIRLEFTPYQFSYTRDAVDYELEANTADGENVLKLEDKHYGIWNPDEYNICVSRDYVLKTFSVLFGAQGIACNNAKLGLALLWTSPDSKQRGVVKIGEFSCKDHQVNLHLDWEIPKAQLRGSIRLSTILYLSASGYAGPSEYHLANDEGVVLGTMDRTDIILDGVGSAFPIYLIHNLQMPLWNVTCEWEDPFQDQFFETVAINLNTAHRNYKYLDQTKRTYNDQMLKEIIASALTIIIVKLRENKEDWNEILKGENLAPGSVGQAINYYIDTLDWKLNSPESISLSIREYLEGKM